MANYHQVQKQGSGQLLSLGISVYIMLWIAILNGYPIVFDDTGEYLVISFSLKQSPYRSILYSVFIRLVAWGMTPWLIVIVQCAITIYILHCVFEYVVQKSPKVKSQSLFFLGLVAFLAFATTLPWHAGQLMPDVFSGLAFLCVFLLLYDSELSLGRTVVLSSLLAISAGCHLSNFLSLGLVLSALLFLRAFNKARPYWPIRSTKGIVVFVLVPILASAGVVVMSNWRAGYGFKLSAGSSVFLLNRLLENGLAAKYLQEQCKIVQLTPCKHLDNLPLSDDFLWGSNPLLSEMGGWLGAREEANRITSGTIRRYPIRFLLDCGKQTLRELVIFKSDDESYPLQSGYTADVFERLYPGDFPNIVSQNNGQVGWAGSPKSYTHCIGLYSGRPYAPAWP